MPDAPPKRSSRAQVFLYAALMFFGALWSFRESVRIHRLGGTVAWGQHMSSDGEMFFYGLVALVVSGALVLVALGVIKGGPGAPE